MNVWNALRRVFGAKTQAPSALRNKPGGMAWVRLGGDDWAARQLDGRAVKCMSVDVDGFWEIEPALPVRVDGFMLDTNGRLATPGDAATVVTIRDDGLEPWKDDGVTDSEVRELYAPKTSDCPRPEIIGLPVREM